MAAAFLVITPKTMILSHADALREVVLNGGIAGLPADVIVRDGILVFIEQAEVGSVLALTQQMSAVFCMASPDAIYRIGPPGADLGEVVAKLGTEGA